MKLIAEEIVEVNFLTEDNGGKTSHFIEGVFLQGEIKNGNGTQDRCRARGGLYRAHC